MKQVVQNYKTGELSVAEVPVPLLRPGGVLVKNHFSIISSGTERASLELARKSLAGKARERPDLVRKVMDKAKRDGIAATVQSVRRRLEELKPLGYSSAGEVIEVGKDVRDLRVGDRVACGGAGYASHAEVIFVPKNLCVRVPEGLDMQSAAFATIGSIALQSVRQAELTLGEWVAVIGLGLIGQLAAQLVRASGCQVLAIDLDQARVELARKLGADCATSARQDEIFTLAQEMTSAVGIDACILAASTTSNQPLELAARLCRDKGRIVSVGLVKMDVPRQIFYQKELELKLSRSYGPGRYDPAYEEQGVDYPVGYVRWTERRNLSQFLKLVAAHQVNVRDLVTHVFDIRDAEEAYKLISEARTPHLAVTLRYPLETQPAKSIKLAPETRQRPIGGEKIGIGVIGAGNFVRTVLVPELAKISSVELRGIASAKGLHAKQQAEKHNFAYCTSDLEELLQDDTIQALVIATPHNLHARQTVQALQAGKHVFVEKPLATTHEHLEEVMQAAESAPGILMVNYNRRFSPLAKKLSAAFADQSGPLTITYRVNAGPPSREGWLGDPEASGGRIVGEACHFVDFAQFLVAGLARWLMAVPVGRDDDSAVITLGFPDDSVAVIEYIASGDKSFTKERVEVFAGGRVAVLEDFRKLEIVRGGRRHTTRKLSQDKGHGQALRAFFDAIRTATGPPISLAGMVATTLATLEARKLLQVGSICKVPLPEFSTGSS